MFKLRITLIGNRNRDRTCKERLVSSHGEFNREVELTLAKTWEDKLLFLHLLLLTAGSRIALQEISTHYRFWLRINFKETRNAKFQENIWLGNIKEN